MLGCLIKLIGLVAILFVVLLVLVQFGGGSCIRTIDRTVPTIDDATWEVTTPYKLYYANKVDYIKDIDGRIITVTMIDWYEQVGNKRIRHADTITLDSRVMGNIEVKRRSD